MADFPRFQHRRAEYKRVISSVIFSYQMLLTLIWTLGFILIALWQKTAVDRLLNYSPWAVPPPRPIPKLRSLVFNLTDFGAVGDGVTLNTKAFERAISVIRNRGGGQLNVAPGYWLTAPFNLTSHMTLFLAENAVILGIDVSTVPFLMHLAKILLLVLESNICITVHSRKGTK